MFLPNLILFGLFFSDPQVTQQVLDNKINTGLKQSLLPLVAGFVIWNHFSHLMENVCFLLRGAQSLVEQEKMWISGW